MVGIKNTGHIDLISCTYTWGIYVYMCARYEISMIKPVAGRAVDK